MRPRSKKFHQFKKILHQHRLNAESRLYRRHRHLKRIIKKHEIRLGEIRQKGARAVTTGAIAGSILATSAAVYKSELMKAAEPDGLDKEVTDEEKRKFVDKILTRYGPKKLETENSSQNILLEVGNQEDFQEKIKQLASQIDKNTAAQHEEEVAKLIQANYGIKSSVSLEGKRLNTYYGPLGAEQHLPRYPGDSAVQHTEDLVLQRSGITPGRGAWGLWTNSKNSLTPEQVEQEKYYIAAQTFLAPGWRENTKSIYEFFKQRKIIMVNPGNAKAVVAVIGDSGPATWTGKNFGGSPEVMQALEARDGRGRASVFVLLVDDPENKIPLGPVVINQIRLASK